MGFISDKLDAMKTVLETVSGAENVYTRDKLTVKPDEFKQLFTKRTSSGKYQVNTWTIGIESFAEAVNVRPRYIASIPFVIKGFLSFDEDSDSQGAFYNIIDAIRTAFRANASVWNVCEEEAENALQGRLIGYSFFGEKLCHYCELVAEIEEHNYVT